MADWKKLIDNENLSNTELRRVPCVHRDVIRIIRDYFLGEAAPELPPVKNSVRKKDSDDVDLNYWINAYDYGQYLQQVFNREGRVIRPGIFYEIAEKFVNAECNLIKMYLHQMPLRTALAGFGSLGNTINNVMAIEVIFISGNKFNIQIKPMPYFRKITMGSYCHFVRGMADSIFAHKGLISQKTKEAFCSVDLKTLVTKAYANLDWDYREDKKFIYLNNQPLAEKIKFKHYSSKQMIAAAKILRNVRINGNLIFKQHALYNAPYCCLEGRCPTQNYQEIDEQRKMIENTLRAIKEKEMIIFNHEAAQQIESAVDKVDRDDTNTRTEITKAIDYIYRNYDKKLTVDQVAKYAAISTSHFNRIFKQQTGKSPSDYLLQCRLETARELLITRKHQVSTIALQCGFNTPSHFSYCFKKKYNLTPKQYIESKT